MDGDSGKYARLPEGVWPFCKKCFNELNPLYADVQTIIDRYDRVKQVLVHSSCNWHVKER